MESLRHSLRRGREIGALGVVVHTGSATGGRTRAVALAQVRERMLPLLDELTHDDDPYLLLESTAGQGSSLCSRTWDFGPYFEALDAPPEAGRLPGHLPRLRGRARPGRRRAGCTQTLDLLVDDGRRGPAEADPRQRLQGRRRAPTRTATRTSARATSARSRSAS